MFEIVEEEANEEQGPGRPRDAERVTHLSMPDFFCQRVAEPLSTSRATGGTTIYCARKAYLHTFGHPLHLFSAPYSALDTPELIELLGARRLASAGICTEEQVALSS